VPRYSLGYFEGGIHRGLHRKSGDGQPILADRLPAPDRPASLNHGGSGQNVLFLGGRVQ
jgi:hypothetical protein